MSRHPVPITPRRQRRAQAYWTGRSNTLGVAGTEVASFAGESYALADATRPRATLAIWIPGAPL